MPIRTDNLNLNLNLNLGAAGAAGGVTGYGRARFNTEDMDKLMPVPPPQTLPLPAKKYTEDWDPELRAWAYVGEFITACPWGTPPVPTNPPGPVPVHNTPILHLLHKVNSQTRFPVPYVDAANPLDEYELANQVVEVVNASLDRADRSMEILDQATGPGALNYWTGLLRIDPVQDKSAFLLMLVARKIGEYVAMGLKNFYLMRRPSQVYPYILPLIDPPDTPSFPSSHSLQAHLISYVLIAALTRHPGPGGVTPQPETEKALKHLATRVARNREIAGLHYPMDSRAGRYVAKKCLAKLEAISGSSLFSDLLAKAKTELSDLP